VSGPYHYSERDARCGVDDEERVWPLDSLDLLDKLGTPVWLAIACSYSDSTRYPEQLCWCPSYGLVFLFKMHLCNTLTLICSPGGFQNTVRPIYQNTACKRSLGSFRSQGDIRLRLNSQTLPEKQNRRDLFKQLLPVSHTLLGFV
jgi:hypothetical protein